MNSIITNNTTHSLISVCMLCYNHEKYVAQSIESVLSQTYEVLELIIVDNASSDNSRNIIEHYSKQDSRIKFFPLKTNMFPSGGSNFGIEQCSGDYIALLSADDYFEPMKIESQCNYMKEHDILCSFSWVNIVDDTSAIQHTHSFNDLFNRHFEDDQLEEFLVSRGNTLCAVSAMLHRSIFDQYGKFDHRLLQLQDYDLWLRISLGETLHVIPQKLVNYRVRSDNQNLSSETDRAGSIRTAFEYVNIVQTVLSHDTSLLSKITGKPCDDKNKYLNLFEYYCENNNKPYAASVLLKMFEHLDRNFSFPSQLYNDFLNCYSRFDLFNKSRSTQRSNYIQLFVDLGEGISEENSIKLPVAQNTNVQEFVLDLSDKPILTALRLDPFNVSCVIEIEKCTLITDQGEIDLQRYIASNALIHHGNSYFFDHNDPQIYFNYFGLEKTKIKKLITRMRFVHIGKDAIQMCVNQTIIDKDHVIASKDLELNQTKTELHKILLSHSWKITKPIRKIKQMIKGN